MSGQRSEEFIHEQLLEKVNSPLTRRSFLRGVAGVGGVLVLAKCGGSGGEGGDGEGGDGELSVLQSTLTATIDWEAIRGFEDAQIVYNTYDQLFDLQPGERGEGGALVADSSPQGIKNNLVEEWELASDGVTNVLRLRKGVKSFFGNEMTADDVVWMFDKALNSGTGQFYYTDVAGIEPGSYKKTDEYTVEVRQKEPNPLFRPLFAGFTGSVFDSTEVTKHVTAEDPFGLAWLGRNDAGFGRYHVTRYAPGEEMVIEANPNYWGDKPEFNRITFRQIDESSNRLALLLRGTAGVAEWLAPADNDKARRSGDQGVHVIDANVSSLYIHLFVGYTPPFDDVNVRRGIALAIPYDNIVSQVFFGAATAAKSHIPQILFGSTPEFFAYDTDVEKARALLEEGGAVGRSLRLTYETARPEIEQVAKILDSALRDVGLNIELDPLPAATYTERLQGKQYELLVQAGYPTVGDPIYLLKAFFLSTSPFNWANYKNTQVDDLILRAGATQDAEERRELVVQIQEILMSELPSIEIVWPGTHFATRTDIDGWVLYPDNTTRYYLLNEA